MHLHRAIPVLILAVALLQAPAVGGASPRSSTDANKGGGRSSGAPYRNAAKASGAPKRAASKRPAAADEGGPAGTPDEIAAAAAANVPHTSKQQQREELYEAYNLLHSLAQDFHKPFDAPAVLVVGYQTSGKSALIEALMGFQFNQVGGGTKTRRPIALRMQYNPRCSQPHCFLTTESGREEERSLAEIQAYIESENQRLERDPVRCFDSREIVVRMEYKFCPNMIIIDTPGLIVPPRGRSLGPQQRALVQASREAEALVLSKMRCKDYVILCVEDTTDFKHATTRNFVQQIDPELSRTVVVTPKLDTKLPQFGTPQDLSDFLRAGLMKKLYPHMLGGPFFTSVPCGRVGPTRDHHFFSNEAFVHGIRRLERADLGSIENSVGDVDISDCTPRIGVSKLRRFLERRVEDCYRRNVARMVPLLQAELRSAEQRLEETESQLDSLSVERLKSSANLMREHFVRALSRAIQGSIQAPPGRYGESLESEQMKGGSFLTLSEGGSSLQPEAFQRALEHEVGHTRHKLFGGAQYHRALREFGMAVRYMPTPEVTEDEIANAAGVGDMHDGVNFMRAACVIAMEKAKAGFDPLLTTLRHRVVHIMKRLYGVAEYMLQAEGQVLDASVGKGPDGAPYSQPFSQILRRIYNNFVEETADDCVQRCRDDIRALTRYVTWDINDARGSASSTGGVSDAEHLVQIYTMAVAQKEEQQQQQQQEPRRAASGDAKAARVLDEWERASGPGDAGGKQLANVAPAPRNKEWGSLLQMMEEVACSRDENRTSAVVSALVQHIIRSWRQQFAKAIVMKFNCFFMMPFVDEFPFYLRNELDRVYEGDVSHLFDITEAKSGLMSKREVLLSECKANERLQKKFYSINSQLKASKHLWAADEDEILPVDRELDAIDMQFANSAEEEEEEDDRREA